MRARGAEHLKLLTGYGGIYENRRVQAMLDRTVARLKATTPEATQPFAVTILNSPSVNAFALPSGDLYVTRGLLALANDESELAAVIAHEIAHVTADHAALRERQAQAAALARRVSEVVVDPTVKAATADQAASSQAEFTQAQELEADEIGVRMLAAAGFDPFAAARFLTAMKRFSNLPALSKASEAGPGFLSSHPSTPRRVEAAKRAARQYGAPGLGQTERAAYLRTIDGLLYGDDPREGYVRGREFAHVDLGIAFTVPEGYILKNTSQAVLATDGANTAIRFDAVKVPADLALDDYLRSGWIKGLVDASVRTEERSGMPMAFAAALVEGWSFRIAAVRGPRRVYRFIFASSRPAESYADAFERTISSFRLLSPAQRAAMRPLRLRAIPVQPDDTMARLAARMHGIEPALRRPLFDTLNGLEAGERLEPGQLAKIIVE